MKKFLSILVVAALFVCCMAPAAFAAAAVQLEVSSAAAATGEEVTLTVSVKDAKLATYGMRLTWDESALELVGMEYGEADLGNLTLNPANGMIADSTTRDKTLDGVICTVTFKAIATVSGEYEVGLDVDNTTAADLTALESEVTAGVVTITAPHTCQLTAVAAKEATCEEAGNVAYDVCEECGKMYIDGVEVTAADVVIPALGHAYDAGVVTTPATCEKAGVMTYTCARCGHVKTEAIPALGHNYENGVCTNCGQKKPSGAMRPTGPYYDANGNLIVLPFVDVLESDWFYGDVLYVYANGLMNGTSATTFSPYAATTRGQIVTILYRLEGSPAVAGACAFTDVAAGSYYEQAITWAAANGIVNGYDATTFGPDDMITREQMAAILFRYAQGKGMASVTLAQNLAGFTDAANISAYAVDAMNWAVGQGLINGMGDGTVAPQGQAIRAQAAAILHRFCETLELI